MSTISQPRRHFPGIFAHSDELWREVDSMNQNPQGITCLSAAIQIPDLKLSRKNLDM
jgi:hypothetical protein